ncbi:MAG: hypothetical protein E7525_03155 [Ruminococcaceae bacterium]|nr:hypothetical protein [Oscillospiraceae bacterium]
MKNKNILRHAEHKVLADKKILTKNTWFKVARVFFYVVGAYCLLVSTTMILGCLFTMDEYSSKANVDEVALYNEASVQLWSMIFTVGTTVATFVLLKFKKIIPFSVLGLVNCLVSFVVFYGASVKNDIKNGGQVLFWSTFGIPSIVFAALAIGIGVVMFIERMRVNKAYDDYVTAIYNTYSEGGSKSLTPEQYEKIMDNYNGQELFRSDIPLKKSQKRRKQKQEQQSATVDSEE